LAGTFFYVWHKILVTSFYDKSDALTVSGWLANVLHTSFTPPETRSELYRAGRLFKKGIDDTISRLRMFVL
jgi:hypothetical protein